MSWWSEFFSSSPSRAESDEDDIANCITKPGPNLTHELAHTHQFVDRKRPANERLESDVDKKMRHETPAPPTSECLNRNGAKNPIVLSDDDDDFEARQNKASSHVLASIDGKLDDLLIDKAFHLMSSLRHDTFRLESLQVKDYTKFYKQLLAHRMTHTTRVLAPVYLEDAKHWVLCVLVQNHSLAANSRSGVNVTLKLYDSCPGEDHLSCALDILRTAAKAILCHKEDETTGEPTAATLFDSLLKPERIHTQEISCPRQTNDIDCGMATIVNALAILAFKDVDSDKEEQAQYYFKSGSSTLWREVLRLLIESDIDNMQATETCRPDEVCHLLQKIDGNSESNTSSTRSMSIPSSSVQNDLKLNMGKRADLRGIIEVLKRVKDTSTFNCLEEDRTRISATIDQLSCLPCLITQASTLKALKNLEKYIGLQLDRGRRTSQLMQELILKLEPEVTRTSS